MGDLIDLSRRPILRRLEDAAASPQGDGERWHLPWIFTQLSMPRSKTPARVWTRQFRDASLRIDAGALWIDGQWQEQPLPYGPKPRLLLAYICTEALRHGPVVELDRSTRALMRSLNLGQDGREISRFRQQSLALAASTFALGWQRTTESVKPIKTWVDDGKLGRTLVLSDDFFKTLKKWAVPLDLEAMARLIPRDKYGWTTIYVTRINGIIYAGQYGGGGCHIPFSAQSFPAFGRYPLRIHDKIIDATITIDPWNGLPSFR